MALVHLDDLRLGPGDALVVVDMQNDFMPGGSLAVPRGDEVIPVLNRAVGLFAAAGLPVVATRDWHPPDHISFRARGGPWPAHCVQGTPGAELVAGLRLPPGTVLVSKATDPEREAYSPFQGTDLAERLEGLGARHLFVGGVATDYCVLRTVLDALGLCQAVSLLVDAVRPVDATPGDGERAVRAMLDRGAVAVEVGAHRPSAHP